MRAIAYQVRLLIACILVLGVQDAWPQGIDKTTSFHVKLRDPVGSKSSRAGDAIAASVISPERFLGAKLTGTVEEAAGAGQGRLRFTFRTLEFKGKQYAIVSQITEFVNSKGHPSVDEQERAVQVQDGALVSEFPDLLLDEGAEVRLRVNPGK